MAIAFQTASTPVAGTASSTGNLPLPSGTVNGDLIIVAIIRTPGAPVQNLTTQGGDTKFNFTDYRSAAGMNAAGTVSKVLLEVFWKVAKNEPANYNFTFSISTSFRVVIVRINGQHKQTPVFTSAISSANTDSQGTVTAAAITLATVGQMFFWIFGVLPVAAVNASPFAPHATTPVTNEADDSGVSSSWADELCYHIPTATGSTGTRTSTPNTAVWGHGSVSLGIELPPANYTPDVPTSLQVTSGIGDNTPVFQASIFDWDTSQQIKGRFTIYQSDQTTVVGTVDSSFRTGAGTVSAEYTTGLSPGTYYVDAMALDDLAATSARTTKQQFQIATQVNKDLGLVWTVGVAAQKDLGLLWNVIQNNVKDLAILWNTLVTFTEDLTLKWKLFTPWVEVPDEGPEIWTEVTE